MTTNSNSTSPFNADKPELLHKFLDRYGVRYNRNRIGWQPVSCVDSGAHPKGDRNPSASVNLTVGYYTCHACGLKGDTFSLMLELENMKAVDVLNTFEQERDTDDGWLI
jgi:hypothetical protein